MSGVFRGVTLPSAGHPLQGLRDNQGADRLGRSSAGAQLGWGAARLGRSSAGALLWGAALGRCSGPLLWAAALGRCSGPLHFGAALCPNTQVRHSRAILCIMSDLKAPPAPLFLDPSFLTAIDDPTSRPADNGFAAVDEAPAAVKAPIAPTAAPTFECSFPLVPLPQTAIPAAYAKSVDPNSPVPQRMMAARAMVPIPPKVLVPVLYQLIMDSDAKVAAAAHHTFVHLDEKLAGPAVSEPLPPQVLEALAHVLIGHSDFVERILLNKATPDTAFVFVALRSTDAKIVNVIVENQERLLRSADIVRALRKNGTVLRSDLNKAIDFMVREGIFLDDVQEFEDAFLRLGKAEMLEVLKNVTIGDEHLSEAERLRAADLGLSADEFISLGTSTLTEEQREAMLDELGDDERAPPDYSKMPFLKLPIPIQIKMAMTGPHEKAIEGLNSANRAVAGSAIRNPKIKENDVVKISRSKSMHEDVIRFICNNADWTKSYPVKLNLIQNPKTPPSLVARWLPLVRANDLRNLSRSKQVPSSVQLQAKRMLSTRER